MADQIPPFIAGDTNLANRIKAAWLNDVNNLRYQAGDAARGAALLTMVQSGTGAVARSVQSKERDVASVFDFMTTAQIADVQANTALVDVATAIQSAVSASGSKMLFFPTGTYLIGTQINVTSGVGIVGEGIDTTIIKLNSATMIGFNVTCSVGFSMRDIRITTSLTASAGAGIKVNGTGGGVNTRSRFFNVECLNMWQGIAFEAGEGWIVDSCGFFGIVDAGIVIKNTVNPDAGDNWIVNSYFSGGVAASDSIRHQTSGGLTVSGCKFQASGTAYHMLWDSTTGSSQIYLRGNHVEPQLTGGFIFERTVASGGIAGIDISDNYLRMTTAIPCVWAKTNSISTLAEVTLHGNIYNLGTSGTCIQLDGGGLYTIVGEQFQGNGGTSVGIATGNATAFNIFLGGNQFFSITTPYSINTASQIQGFSAHGTATNDSAVAGDIGEYISSTIATGSSVSLTTNTTANITSISLTPGDWDVTGVIDFTFGATTSYTNLIGGISTTSATIGAQDSKFDYETAANIPTAGSDPAWVVPIVRISIAATTTVYLVVQGTFTVSTLKAYGTIRARRIR